MKRIFLFSIIAILISCKPVVENKNIYNQKTNYLITLPPKWTETSTNTNAQLTPTSSPTLTPTYPFTPTPTYTFSPSIFLSPTNTIPTNIQERAQIAGMTPEEVMNVYSIIHNALGANDPSPLTGLVWYPMIGCNRCGGRIIETPKDFINLYYEKMDEKTRRSLYNQKPEDLFINWEGVMFGHGEIWLSKLCERNNLQSCKIYIVMFMYYCEYNYEYSTPYPLAVNESNFTFGVYAVTSNTIERGSALDDKDIAEIMQSQVYIYPNRYWSDPHEWFGTSCKMATVEFCPPYDDQYSDPSSVSTLNVICGDDISIIFDVITATRIGYYYDGYYFHLDNISK